MIATQEYIPSEQGPPPHILVMEDEASVAQGLQLVLSEEGYDVDVAMTGGSACECLSVSAGRDR